MLPASPTNLLTPDSPRSAAPRAVELTDITFGKAVLRNVPAGVPSKFHRLDITPMSLGGNSAASITGSSTLEWYRANDHQKVLMLDVPEASALRSGMYRIWIDNRVEALLQVPETPTLECPSSYGAFEIPAGTTRLELALPVVEQPFTRLLTSYGHQVADDAYQLALEGTQWVLTFVGPTSKAYTLQWVASQVI